MKDDHSLYEIVAVLLPVALGLGLIYLYATGSLDMTAILLVVVGMVVLVPLVAILVELRDDDRMRNQERTRRRFRHIVHR